MMRLRLMSAPMKDTGASPSEGELFEEIERLPEGDCLDLMRTVVESRFPINGTRTVLIRDKKGAVTGLRLEKVKVESSEDMDTIREEIKMLFASEKPKG
jgi:hypothetical protein